MPVLCVSMTNPPRTDGVSEPPSGFFVLIHFLHICRRAHSQSSKKFIQMEYVDSVKSQNSNNFESIYIGFGYYFG